VNENVKNRFEQADVNGDNPLVLNGSVKVNDADVTNDQVFVKEITCTLAEINAGKVLVDGVTDRQLQVVDFTALVDGTFTTCTSVDIQDDTLIPVKVAVIAVAALGTGSMLKPNTANVTRDVGFGLKLAAGKSVVVANVGSAALAGTAIKFFIFYKVI
jgi:hypothetical protein